MSGDPMELVLRGNARLHAGDAFEAEAAYRKALELLPKQGELYTNLGNALRRQGRLGEALEAHRKAIALAPQYAVAYNNLGSTLLDLGWLHDAELAFQECLALTPTYAIAHQNLGRLMNTLGRLDDAISCFRTAILHDSRKAMTRLNLASTLHDQGRQKEAVAEHRRAVELDPAESIYCSGLAYELWFDETDPAPIIAEHRRWFTRHAAPLLAQAAATRHANDRSPDRPLRVGYVSPDLRHHPVGRLIAPVVMNHNPSQVELFIYDGAAKPDALTRQLLCYGKWVNTVGWSDQALADHIRQDRIDVLVDLTAHMANTRLLAFARRPAPVQVAYLAYPATTGLPAIDYRLTTRHFESPEESARDSAERPYFLPDNYWCYTIDESIAPAAFPPAVRRGYVTFATTNNFAKVTPATIYRWAQLLDQVPNSRLMVVVNGGEPGNRGLRDRFQSLGIAPNRLEIMNYSPRAEFLRFHDNIDIVLDTFPCNGGATSLDALSMGVPVVSLAGTTTVSRSGLSILSNLGLEDLAAHSPESYVQIAANLAGNVTRLAELRSTLCGRMKTSALTDANRFTREIEKAYRAMWQAWLTQT